MTVSLPGPNNLYPEDLIPFTRYPLFLVIDSENSHAFKAGLSELNLSLVDENHYHEYFVIFQSQTYYPGLPMPFAL